MCLKKQESYSHLYILSSVCSKQAILNIGENKSVCHGRQTVGLYLGKAIYKSVILPSYLMSWYAYLENGNYSNL